MRIQTLGAALQSTPEVLAEALEQEIYRVNTVRQRTLSIGIPILLSDGERVLRGPTIKSGNAYRGWVDLTPANMAQWQNHLWLLRESLRS